MAKLNIESVDFQDEAFQPLVALIATKVDEAFDLHQARRELPPYMKKKEACIYLSCSFNTLQKLIRNGLEVVMVDGIERISKKSIDEFMEKNTK